MGRRAPAITALAISKLKGARERRDGVAPGLVLRGRESGAKSWCLVFVSPKTRERRRFTIGPALGGVGELERVRAEAGRLRELVRSGVDPCEQQKHVKEAKAAEAEEADARTFANVIKGYTRELGRLKRGPAILRMIERELLPRWGSREIGSIGRADVERVVAAIADRPAAARALHANIRRLLNWAGGREAYGLGDAQNPASRVRISDLAGKKVIRTRTLSNDELRALWRASERTAYPFGHLIRLLMLAAVRRGEASGAEWSEFDFTARLWTIPARRMKGGAAHLVPITAEIAGLVQGVPRIEGAAVLFIASTSQLKPVTGFSQAKVKLDALMLQELRAVAAARGDDPTAVTLASWTLHDIRRTVRTHLSALPIEERVRELLLAHAQPGLHQVYDQYSYVEEKRHGLELWAARLKGIIDPAPVDTVVLPLRAMTI
jgi:integrase